MRDDLKHLETTRPTVVSESVLRALQDAVDHLRGVFSACGALDETADAAIHGDLWHSNILVGSAERAAILDWDDLVVGDPMWDWATLTGYRVTARGVEVGPFRVDHDFTIAERERLGVLRRASLLDWAIDSLADWQDAGDAPQFMRAMRAEKERVHRLAWAEYRSLFAHS